MALTTCPSCNKRISSKVEQCPHCDFRLSGQSEDELNREHRRLVDYQRDKLMQQSMLALLIAIAAFSYYFLAQPMPGSIAHAVSIGLMVVGFIWYMINRARLLFLKKGRR